MKSVTEQYEDQSVTVTRGHNPNLDTVPVPQFTEEQHGTWKIMFDRQMEQLPGRASREFMEALERMKLPSDRIPTLKYCHERLQETTGWGVTRVEGLVPEKEFFECLSQKLFPCTDFIRERSEIEYTPSPDMFHDIFGHLPLITDPIFSEFYHFFGKVAQNASPEQLTALQRIYWFSVEFGLINNPEGLRIYGSGILSSVGEAVYCLSDEAIKHHFDFDKVAAQYFEIHHMQGDLFVIDSFEQLLEGFKEYARREGLLDEAA